MRRLVFATTNAGKLAELKLLVGQRFEVVGQAEVAHVPEVIEDAPTFAGNAEKKALAFARATGDWALADDSGLCVDALGGAPGVLSARYAPTDHERIDKLLSALSGVAIAQRGAHFACALCLAGPEGVVATAEGRCSGTIGFERRGTHGFGYDPLFILPSGQTLAELSTHEKSAISHRGRAFAALLQHPRLLE